MAVRISSSKFLESGAAKAAVLDGLDDPLYTGGGPLPAGIRDGVAKLKDVWFENDDKYGESFKAEAEIVLPESFNGRFIKGKITRQWITFNSDNLDDRIPRIRDILKGLGGRAIFGDGKNVNFFKIAEFLAAATKKTPIYFSFSTSPKETGEWPWENWHMAIPGFREQGSTPPQTEPQKKTEPSVNGNKSNHSADPLPWTERQGWGKNQNQSPLEDSQGQSVAVVSSEPTVADTYSDSDDLSSVVKRAVAKDNNAIDKLEEWAKDLGYSEDDLEEAPSYEVIGEWIKTGKRKEELTESTPAKSKRVISEGQVYTYAPVNKKDETKRLKERECRVTSVDNMREVATIVNLSNKAEVYEVSWDDVNLK